MSSSGSQVIKFELNPEFPNLESKLEASSASYYEIEIPITKSKMSSEFQYLKFVFGIELQALK